MKTYRTVEANRKREIVLLAAGLVIGLMASGVTLAAQKMSPAPIAYAGNYTCMGLNGADSIGAPMSFGGGRYRCTEIVTIDGKRSAGWVPVTDDTVRAFIIEGGYQLDGDEADSDEAPALTAATSKGS